MVLPFLNSLIDHQQTEKPCKRETDPSHCVCNRGFHVQRTTTYFSCKKVKFLMYTVFFFVSCSYPVHNISDTSKAIHEGGFKLKTNPGVFFFFTKGTCVDLNTVVFPADIQLVTCGTPKKLFKCLMFMVNFTTSDKLVYGKNTAKTVS